MMNPFSMYLKKQNKKMTPPNPPQLRLSQSLGSQNLKQQNKLAKLKKKKNILCPRKLHQKAKVQVLLDAEKKSVGSR